MSTARVNPDQIRFRRAGVTDWSAIWPIFREVIRSGDTYTFPPELPEAEARAAWLFDGTDRRHTFVSEIGGRTVGTAILRPNQPGLGNHVANAAWMIAPTHAGKGIGRAFALHVLDEARRLGFTGMQFNAVVATNRRAIRLWEGLGFQTVGTVPGAFRHATQGPVAIHVMYMDL